MKPDVKFVCTAMCSLVASPNQPIYVISLCSGTKALQCSIRAFWGKASTFAVTTQCQHSNHFFLTLKSVSSCLFVLSTILYFRQKLLLKISVGGNGGMIQQKLNARNSFTIEKVIIFSLVIHSDSAVLCNDVSCRSSSHLSLSFVIGHWKSRGESWSTQLFAGTLHEAYQPVRKLTKCHLFNKQN